MINISIYYLVHLFIRYSSSNEKTRSFQSQVFKFQSSISTKVSFQYYYQFDLWRWRPIDFVTLYVFIPLTQTSNIQISVTSSIAITSISCSYNTKFLSIRLIKHVNTITCKRFSYVTPIMSIIYLKYYRNTIPIWYFCQFVQLNIWTTRTTMLNDSLTTLQRLCSKSRYIMVF